MLMNTSKMIAEYHSDFGIVYKNVPVKIKEGYQDILPYTDRPDGGIPCPPARLFKLRYLEVTYDTGEKIQHPIAKASEVVAKAGDLLRRTQAPKPVCIDYIGERWPYIPASVIGLTGGYNNENRYESTPRGLREDGSFSYNSDVLGTMRAKYSIEEKPSELLAIAKQCLEDIQPNAICAASLEGFTPRRFIPSFINQLEKRITRTANVSYDNPTEIVRCARIIGEEAICLSYQGEIMRNLQHLIQVT